MGTQAYGIYTWSRTQRQNTIDNNRSLQMATQVSRTNNVRDNDTARLRLAFEERQLKEREGKGTEARARKSSWFWHK